MGIKTSEILSLLGAINVLQATNVPASPKFGYAAAINQKRLAPVGESFEASRKQLIEDYAQRDDNGQIVTTGEGQNQQVTLKDPDGFRAAEKSLLDMEVDVTIHKVKFDTLPQSIGTGIMVGLMPMIFEEDEAPAAAAPREIGRPTPVLDAPAGNA